MSATTSAATGRCFGIQRVCQVWERSRSALYARRARAHHRLGAGPARRGPPPRQSDAQLLAAIRTDLARSPFHGEGHRKVHARLRILDGIRVARTRVLRVMRAHGLLSPHRGRQGAAKTHDGRVITQAPNVMWGTDGVRVFTLDDGWGWIFAAVEHWNAECVGWHVCKVGSRFAALDPIAQGLERLYGWLCCNFRAATSGWTTFGKHRTGSPIMPSDNPFKWRQFEPALILQCVRWYLRYALSYRDLKDMMRERGLCVDHTTIYRWVQRYAPEIDKRCRPFLRRTNDSYRIDETYVRVAGAWTYLYRGVDSNGDTLDFLLRATRDRKAAIAFFRKTLGAAHTTPPRVVTVDKNPAYPVAFEAVRHEGLVRPRSNLRQCKYLNNIIEQDHRFIKRRTRPMLGFKRFTTAWRTLRGIEIMHALRKGQARWMAKGDVVGQTQLIHKVFGLAA